MDRKTITQFALAALGDDHDWTVDKALANWWSGWSGNDPTSSLQLTLNGNGIFKRIFDSWEVDISGVVISPRVIMQLSKLDCPWYLYRTQHRITEQVVALYGAKQATFARLFLGNQSQSANVEPVNQWLSSIG